MAADRPESDTPTPQGASDPISGPSEPRPLALDYRRPQRRRAAPIGERLTVIGPFAAGAFSPFVVFAIWYSGFFWIELGFWFAWGVTAVFVLAIKVRAALFPLRPVSRPWWACVLGGAVNTLALIGVVKLTTARPNFWPPLGVGGSIAAAFVLALLIAYLVASVLTPRWRNS